MATNSFYITAGLPPRDLADGVSTGTNRFFIAAGLVPDDIAAAVGGGSIGRWVHTIWYENMENTW